MQVTVMSLPDTFDKTSDTVGIFGTVHEKKIILLIRPPRNSDVRH